MKHKTRVLVALPLLLPLVIPQQVIAQTISPVPTNSIESFLVIKKDSFPDMGANYEKTVLEPRRAAEQAEKDRLAKEAAEAEKTAQIAYTPVFTNGYLTGSYGYLVPGNNCVDLARRYGKVQSGNPISWYTTTRTPFIGAAVLFYYNHVGIISGIWSNGDVEVIQENAPGAPSRYSPAMLRGYF